MVIQKLFIFLCEPNKPNRALVGLRNGIEIVSPDGHRQKVDETMLRTTIMTALFHLHPPPLFHQIHLRFTLPQTYHRLIRPILSINTPHSISSSPSSSTAFAQISNEQLFDLDRKHLSCSMPNTNRPLKVAVLLSGGVDSSVALRLLHAAGHSCTAFYLKIWFQEDFENFWSQCPWEDDLKYAKAVCSQVDVPLEVVHLTDEYWDKVVTYLIEEYKCGRTPNPDVLCNTRIKFGAFMDAISNMDFDYVASGHYAKVVHTVTDENSAVSFLELSKDMVKDQTYFLSYLSQAQLKRLVLPLGCIPKDEVRKLARKFDLPNQDRKDSQGICFLGKIKFSEFVGRHIGEKEGVILEAETGDFLGSHRGFWFYTIGQRQGLKLAGGPWYVVEKDVKNNVVFVSRNYYSVDKRRRSFHVGSFRWISGSPPRNLNQLKCKVRHGPDFYNCTLHMELAEDGTEIGSVQLPEDDQGLAAGQFAAFYEEQVCVGSGVILESWDDNGFPVCEKAREIAKMEDKSKLGKPVKIKPKPDDCLRNSVVRLV
ncbi:hypothetical protein QVD17_24083 [Tagetes erecta]|uniref:tRNA-5-taurinomethyluridine 2-sulfurtransferase n=1 Tax=Tagetes erecta TaxID=13708 RepID=A0AAD8NUI9_TARER|nr:hypothetical protein QVD17_24083 [Tagetes erecta]